jgi:hypothetical protein
MKEAAISYDVVMDEDDNSFAEGTYRLPGEDWKVFIVTKLCPVETMEVRHEKWASGVTGVHVRLPKSEKLNKQTVEEILSKFLKIEKWKEVRGPDSLQLR